MRPSHFPCSPHNHKWAPVSLNEAVSALMGPRDGGVGQKSRRQTPSLEVPVRRVQCVLGAVFEPLGDSPGQGVNWVSLTLEGKHPVCVS